MRADKALAELQSGAKFAVAASYSDAQDALQGGGPVGGPGAVCRRCFLEQLETPRRRALTTVLRSANGFHIIPLQDNAPNRIR